jgi:hypothetical protein
VACFGGCKVPATTRLLLAPQASPRGAAGEPRKNPYYYALKPSRTPSSWARFSVVFSRSGDLSFPIFTKPMVLFCEIDFNRSPLDAPRNRQCPFRGR